MQGNDFVQSVMYTHGVTCFSCHDVHGTENNADLLKPANVLCLECHGPNSPNGPHAATHRGAHASRGRERRERMRRLSHAEDRAEDRRRQRPRHTFKFITPKDTELLKVPNPCGDLSRGQARELGGGHAEDLVECFAVARGESVRSE